MSKCGDRCRCLYPCIFAMRDNRAYIYSLMTGDVRTWRIVDVRVHKRRNRIVLVAKANQSFRFLSLLADLSPGWHIMLGGMWIENRTVGVVSRPFHLLMQPLRWILSKCCPRFHHRSLHLALLFRVWKPADVLWCAKDHLQVGTMVGAAGGV